MNENQIVRGFWFHQRGFLRNDNFFCTSLGCLNPSFEKEEKEEEFWERAQVRRRRKGETTPSCPKETRGFRHFWWLCGCLSPLWEFLAGEAAISTDPHVLLWNWLLFCCYCSPCCSQIALGSLLGCWVFILFILLLFLLFNNVVLCARSHLHDGMCEEK